MSQLQCYDKHCPPLYFVNKILNS